MFIDIEHLIFLNNVKVESFVGKVQKNTLCKQTHQKWGDNVLKACPSLQWSLVPTWHAQTRHQLFSTKMLQDIFFSKSSSQRISSA